MDPQTSNWLVNVKYFLTNLFWCYFPTETFDDAYKWMDRINKFEEKHFKLPLEYRVIGELMNRLKVATGKDQFLLQQKLNRAMRLVERKEAFDPNNPSNYGPFEHQEMGQDEDVAESTEFEEERRMIQGVGINEDEDEDDDIFDEMKDRDDILLEKLNSIDKMLEEKLAELDHTFGKKGKVLEEEIRDLADERNSLTEKRGKPLRRLVSDCRLCSQGFNNNMGRHFLFSFSLCYIWLAYHVLSYMSFL